MDSSLTNVLCGILFPANKCCKVAAERQDVRGDVLLADFSLWCGVPWLCSSVERRYDGEKDTSRHESVTFENFIPWSVEHKRTTSTMSTLYTLTEEGYE